MPLSKTRVAAKLQDWKSAVLQYALPTWEELPGLPLYMDQVIMLLNDYLNPQKGVAQGDYAITPAMINNYVKMKIVPSPVKKRYSRIHLAYLIMVCIFKHTLNISSIPKVIPPDLAEEAVHALYNDFVDVHHQAAQDYVRHVENNAQPLLDNPDASAARLVMHLTISANFSSILSSQLALMEEEESAESQA